MSAPENAILGQNFSKKAPKQKIHHDFVPIRPDDNCQKYFQLILFFPPNCLKKNVLTAYVVINLIMLTGITKILHHKPIIIKKWKPTNQNQKW